MKKVLLVHELQKDLLSVSQFTDDYPCKVEFSNVNYVSDQFMASPSEANYHATGFFVTFLALFLMAYIQAHGSLDLYAYSNADWVGCPLTSRSTSGFGTFLGPYCLSWSAKKQPTIAKSSTEAGYCSMGFASATLTWLGFVFRDIGLPMARPPTLYCNNLSSLYLTINPLFHGRSKHIAVDYHYVREKVALGALVTKVCLFFQSIG